MEILAKIVFALFCGWWLLFLLGLGLKVVDKEPLFADIDLQDGLGESDYKRLVREKGEDRP